MLLTTTQKMAKCRETLKMEIVHTNEAKASLILRKWRAQSDPCEQIVSAP